MTEVRWDRLKDLVYDALQRPRAERARFLDDACGDDSTLRREADELLGVDAEIEDSFLNTSPVDAGLQEGDVVAERYRLVRKLGEGGMGQVWLAEQTVPVRRSVALKLIKAGMYDESVVQRFRSERQSLAIMDHPCIAKVFDAGATTQGQPFFVMEYVPGVPITEYCDAHALPIRDRLALFIQACEGVQHAHQKAIIHRDLKPANILVIEVDGKPVPRIIDFGLAKATERATERADQTMLTRYGYLIGTPGYMSPEQVDPDIHDIDTRTDVYSLGVILYVMLSGLQPFESRRRKRPPLDEWLRQLRAEEAPYPSTKVNAQGNESSATAAARGTQPKQLVSQLRGDLDWIAMKALERVRERRYATPLELAADLRRHLNHEPVTARRVSAGYQMRKFIRRHRFAAAFIGMMTILSVMASAAALLAVKQKLEAEHQRTVAERQEAKTLQAQARLLTQTAAQRLKDADVGGAQAIVLEVLTEPAFARARTPDAISVFQESRAADAQLAVLFGHTGFVYSAAYSPDGAMIVTASDDKTVRIWDARSGLQLAEYSGSGGFTPFAVYSPDGSRILTAAGDKTARVIDARTGAALLTLSGHTGDVNYAAYSPDGRRIVSASSDKTARIWDATSGALLAVLSGHRMAVNSVGFSSDSSRVVTASDDTTGRIWDARTGAPLAVLSGHSAPLNSAVYSPDGELIVTASLDNTARIWDAHTGAQRKMLAGHGGFVVTGAFSPDGSHIVTSSFDKTARIWDTRTGKQLEVISGHRDFLLSAAYSPDGNTIVTTSEDRTARVWEAHNSGQERVLAGHIEFVNSAVFSRDGTMVLTSSSDETARIWAAATGGQQVMLSGHADRINSAAYSPDGARIVTASADKTVRIWDAPSGRPIAVLTGHSDIVNSTAYSPDGAHIATASFDRTARIWDARSGAPIRVLAGHGDRLLSVAYSPDGSKLVTGSADKTARIWDVASGRQLLVLSGHGDAVSGAEFSPDGAQVATASFDNTARIWDSHTGVELRVLVGHHDKLASIGYSPDGNYLITGSYDGSARIWAATTGSQLAVLLGHTDRVTYGRYSPDGRHVVTASFDYTARVWDAHVPADIDAQIQWETAAEPDSLPEVDRNRLGLPSNPRERVWSNKASACDEATAAFYDPDRRAPGVLLKDIAVDIASPACLKEITEPKHTARSTYQAARALLAKRDVNRAKQQLELAISEGYRAAQVDLGNLLVDASAGLLDPGRSTTLFQQAWQESVPIAAYLLGHFYEVGVAGSQPDLTRAWEWYQKGADAGEPHALARFAERAERQALAEPDPQKNAGLLLWAFRNYAAAAERAHDEDWPEDAWRNWRYRRATLARLLARQGMMQQIGDAYAEVLAR